MTVLGFDFGTRKIGVAVGNQLTGNARPLTSIVSHDKPNWPELTKIIAEWQPETIVVGLPLNDDGGEQEMSKLCRQFANNLAAYFSGNIELIDERFTSQSAKSHLREARASGEKPRRIRRGEVDSAAAAILLNNWLELNP